MLCVHEQAQRTYTHKKTQQQLSSKAHLSREGPEPFVYATPAVQQSSNCAFHVSCTFFLRQKIRLISRIQANWPLNSVSFYSPNQRPDARPYSRLIVRHSEWLLCVKKTSLGTSHLCSRNVPWNHLFFSKHCSKNRFLYISQFLRHSRHTQHGVVVFNRKKALYLLKGHRRGSMRVGIRRRLRNPMIISRKAVESTDLLYCRADKSRGEILF